MQLIYEIKDAHNSWIRALAYNAELKILASGSDDFGIKIWDCHGDLQDFEAANASRYLYQLIGHSNWVRCLSFYKLPSEK